MNLSPRDAREPLSAETLVKGERYNWINQPARGPTRSTRTELIMKHNQQAMIAAVDAAMVEMQNIAPPLKRSECARLIHAALDALHPGLQPDNVWGLRADRIGHWHEGPETFVIVKAKDVKLGSQTYGPPANGVTSALATRCYIMSEPHLSGYRLVIGFNNLQDVGAAHTWAASQPKGKVPDA